jgi:flagellar basal body-associated protein FliL
MAEEAENQAPEQTSDEPQGGAKMSLWLVLCVIVVAVASAAGYGVGQLLGPAPPPPQAPEAQDEPGGSSAGTEQYSYYDLEPITVNFDDPRMARYVRATITLAVPPDKANEVSSAVQERLPELRNWLTMYLSGCKLEHLRGPKNLNRIRRDIEDAFNRRLWPEQKPRIHHVLFKEFFVQ